MSRIPSQPPAQNPSAGNSQNFMPPRHHPYPHQPSEIHHLPPHAFAHEPSLGGLFPPHANFDSVFHQSSSSQPQPQPPRPPSGPTNFHPQPVTRKPSLLAGYHNPFSSPERNERLISSAMNQQQPQGPPSRFAPPLASPNGPSQSMQSVRAANPAMAEAAAAALAAALASGGADQLGHGGRGGYDSTNAATAAVIAAANTYMNMFGPNRPPVNISPGNTGRPEDKFLRGPGLGSVSAPKLRPISPDISSKDMHMRGLTPSKFTSDDQKELLTIRDRGKIRDISPADDKFISRGGPPPSSASAAYPPHFTSSLMAAAMAANVMSSPGSSNMPPPTSSPSQIVQFIQQLQQQQQQQQPGKMSSQPGELLMNMPPPPPPKKELFLSTNPTFPLQQIFPVKSSLPSSTSQQNLVPLAPPPIASSSSSSSSSSSYVPQVEAISPTPEDQKENSSVQLMKDKIISEIEKVEKDLASTQYQIEMLKKRTIELEEEQSKKPLEGNDDVEKLIQVSKSMTLAEKIYQENRKKADESHRKNLQIVDDNLQSAMFENIPFYHEFSDTKLYQEIRTQFDTVGKKRLIKFFKRQIGIKKQRERSLIDNYDNLHTKWQKKVDRFENSIKKRQKDAKSREFYEKVFPELRKQREERERLIQKQKAVATVALTPSDAASAQASSQTSNTLGSEATENNEPNPIEEERKRILALSVVPPLCLDTRQRRYKFINNNGYVQDPVALFKSIKNEIFWNEKEKEIFLDKLVTFGKNFELIATYLEKKSVQDCIEYYYLTKKKINYKMLIRKNQRRRKKTTTTNTNTSNNTVNSISNNTNSSALNTSNTNGGAANSSNQLISSASSSSSQTGLSSLSSDKAKS